jgi:hypothetical protein
MKSICKISWRVEILNAVFTEQGPCIASSFSSIQNVYMCTYKNKEVAIYGWWDYRLFLVFCVLLEVFYQKQIFYHQGKGYFGGNCSKELSCRAPRRGPEHSDLGEHLMPWVKQPEQD